MVNRGHLLTLLSLHKNEGSGYVLYQQDVLEKIETAREEKPDVQETIVENLYKKISVHA